MKTFISLIALLLICSSSQACWIFGKSKVVGKKHAVQEATTVYTAPVVVPVVYNAKPVVSYNAPVQTAPVNSFTRTAPVVSQPVFTPNCPNGRCPNQ